MPISHIPAADVIQFFLGELAFLQKVIQCMQSTQLPGLLFMVHTHSLCHIHLVILVTFYTRHLGSHSLYSVTL